MNELRILKATHDDTAAITSLAIRSKSHWGYTDEQIGTFKVYGPEGCNKCNDGYKGRVGIYEVVKITEGLSKIIMEDGNSLDIAAQAQKEGFNDLRQSGLLKVMAGTTSLEEVNRVTTGH